MYDNVHLHILSQKMYTKILFSFIYHISIVHYTFVLKFDFIVEQGVFKTYQSSPIFRVSSIRYDVGPCVQMHAVMSLMRKCAIVYDRQQGHHSTSPISRRLHHQAYNVGWKYCISLQPLAQYLLYASQSINQPQIQAYH